MGDASPSIGLDLYCVPDLEDALENCHNSKFDFLSVPLSHPRFHRNLLLKTPTEAFTRSDLILNSQQWSTYIVGKVSTWLDLDSVDESVRRNSELVFLQEMMWSGHLSLPAVLLPSPTLESVNYARNVNSVLNKTTHLQVWLRIPLKNKDAWERWSRFHAICEFHQQLSPVLELSGDLPSNDVLARWLAEPVKAIIISTNAFLTNKGGYPTLPKRYQAFLFDVFKRKIQFLISGRPKHKAGMVSYLQYIKHIWKQRTPPSEEDIYEMPYYDYLQAPLQPLMDNLESQIYETFEKDPVKYREYQNAVYKALMDRLQSVPLPEDDNSIDAKSNPRYAVIMVLGAGRGPLVKASLAAATRAKVRVLVYAVEKNPNAIVTLLNMKVSLNWGEKVNIINSDMRYWVAPEKADIIVSELLGSFGDNELSPECLDGAQKHLKDDGISIPTSYTSYVAPLTASKVWNEVRAYGDLKHFETPYVVKFFNALQLAPVQECFTFTHPTPQPTDNNRYVKLEFEVGTSATLHGFAGYFDCELYKDVHISINPATFSEGMFSWFPLFIPLRNPVALGPKSVVEVHIWRCCTAQRVWYEWGLVRPTVSHIHNHNGRSYWIGL